MQEWCQCRKTECAVVVRREAAETINWINKSVPSALAEKNYLLAEERIVNTSCAVWCVNYIITGECRLARYKPGDCGVGCGDGSIRSTEGLSSLFRYSTNDSPNQARFDLCLRIKIIFLNDRSAKPHSCSGDAETLVICCGLAECLGWSLGLACPKELNFIL